MDTKLTAAQLDALKRQARIELARRDFWEYCKLRAPDFYKENRAYLKHICLELEDFYYSDDKVMIINEPPRHGKTRTAGLFAEWIFGKNPREKIITGAYNEQLSTTFSRNVRDGISERKGDKNRVVYSEIFPKTKIKRGSGAANMWSLEGSHVSYLATSPGGTVTGFGATCFPAGTLISTPQGDVDIADIADENIHHVLTFNHESGNIEIEKISAFRRKLSNDFARITTSTGRTITCTSDHRFYTEERGYVRADQLNVGETFKTLPWNLCRLWETNNGSRATLLGVSQESNKLRSNSNVQLLWKELYGSTVCSKQTDTAWSEGNLLFERVFVPSESRRTENENVSDLWKSCEKQNVLFRQVQTDSVGTEEARENDCVSGMWKEFSSTQSQNRLLFKRMCKCSSLRENERNRQLSLQNRDKLQQRVSRNASSDIGQRQSPVSDLRCEREVSEKRTMGCNEQSCNSPQRPQSAKQRRGKSNNTLSDVSCFTPQNETIISIEFFNDETFVYDIQVEKNHNFFANGILVHNCMIIDDIVKNAEEAYNETVLESHWAWYTNTMLSRLEKGGKVIIIATRWHSDDLSGRALAHYKSIGIPVRLILETALQPDGTMLCDEVLDRASYDLIVKTMGKDIAEANYNQRPIDERNKLYTEGFKTYNQIPQDENGNSLFEVICSYCDVADRGTDYLCNIIYGVYNKQAYVLDVYYTTDGMEVTEPETAKRLYDYGVQRAFIESNNGGRGFGRSVERILRDKYHTHKCMIELFYQSKNKTARILGASTWVQHNVIFPVGWEINYEEFFTHIYKFQRDVKGNKHDDCVDALSGVYEKLGRGNLYSFD